MLVVATRCKPAGVLWRLARHPAPTSTGSGPARCVHSTRQATSPMRSLGGPGPMAAAPKLPPLPLPPPRGVPPRGVSDALRGVLSRVTLPATATHACVWSVVVSAISEQSQKEEWIRCTQGSSSLQEQCQAPEKGCHNVKSPAAGMLRGTVSRDGGGGSCGGSGPPKLPLPARRLPRGSVGTASAESARP